MPSCPAALGEGRGVRPKRWRESPCLCLRGRTLRMWHYSLICRFVMIQIKILTLFPRILILKFMFPRIASSVFRNEPNRRRTL